MATMRVPILKTTCMNGDIASKSNNRPIAMTTVAPKTLELIIVNRVEKIYRDDRKSICFEKGHPTDMCIFTCKEYIQILYGPRHPSVS